MVSKKKLNLSGQTHFNSWFDIQLEDSDQKVKNVLKTSFATTIEHSKAHILADPNNNPNVNSPADYEKEVNIEFLKWSFKQFADLNPDFVLLQEELNTDISEEDATPNQKISDTKYYPLELQSYFRVWISNLDKKFIANHDINSLFTTFKNTNPTLALIDGTMVLPEPSTDIEQNTGFKASIMGNNKKQQSEQSSTQPNHPENKPNISEQDAADTSGSGSSGSSEGSTGSSTGSTGSSGSSGDTTSGSSGSGGSGGTATGKGKSKGTGKGKGKGTGGSGAAKPPPPSK